MKPSKEDEAIEIAFRTRNLEGNWQVRVTKVINCCDKLNRQEGLLEAEKADFLQDYALVRDIAALKKYAQSHDLSVSVQLIDQCRHAVDYFEKPVYAAKQATLFARETVFHRDDLQALFTRLSLQDGRQLNNRPK